MAKSVDPVDTDFLELHNRYLETAIKKTEPLKLKLVPGDKREDFAPVVFGGGQSRYAADLEVLCATIPQPKKKDLEGPNGHKILKKWKTATRQHYDRRMRWVRKHGLYIKGEEYAVFIIADVDRDGRRIVKIIPDVNTKEQAREHSQEVKKVLNRVSEAFYITPNQLLALLGLVKKFSLRMDGEPVRAAWQYTDQLAKIHEGKVYVNTFTPNTLPWYNMVENAMTAETPVDEDNKPLNEWEPGEVEFNAALDNVFLQTTEASRELFEGLFEWNLAYPFQLDKALVVVLGENHTGKSSLSELYMRSVCGARCNINMRNIHSRFTEKEYRPAFGNMRDDIPQVTSVAWDKYKPLRTLGDIKEEQKYEAVESYQNYALEIWTTNWRSIEETPPGDERRFILIAIDDKDEWSNFLETCFEIGNVFTSTRQGYTTIAMQWIRRRLTRSILKKGKPFDIVAASSQSWRSSSCQETHDKLIEYIRDRALGKNTKAKYYAEDMETCLYRWSTMNDEGIIAILKSINSHETAGAYPSITGLKYPDQGDYFGILRVSASFIARVFTKLGMHCNWQTIGEHVKDWGISRGYEQKITGQKRFFPVKYTDEWPIQEVGDVLGHVAVKMRESVTPTTEE